MASVECRSFSARGMDSLRTLANMRPLDVRPTPIQLLTLARHLKTDLKVSITLRGKPLIERGPEEIPGILKNLETDSSHIRDLLVGLGEGLNDAVPGAADEIEFSLSNLVMLTRKRRDTISRRDFIKREAQDLYYFYSLKQGILDVRHKGIHLTWGTWNALAADVGDFLGMEVYRSMKAFAAGEKATMADLYAAFVLVEPELETGPRELPLRLKPLL